MAEEIPLEVKIKSKFDGSGTADAEKGLGGVKGAAKGAEDGLKELGYTAERLKSAFIELLAFSELVTQFKEGVTEVDLINRSLGQLSAVTKQYGFDAKESVEKVEKYADTIGKVAGIADEQTIPALTRLARVVHGDVEQAMALNTLAVKLSRTGVTDYEGAVHAVTLALQGKGRALAQLGINLKDINTDEADGATLIKALSEALKSTSVQAVGVAGAVALMKTQWDETRGGMVKETLPAIITIIGYLRQLMNLGRSIAEAWGVVWDYMGNRIGHFADLVKGVVTLNFSSLKTIQAQANKDAEDFGRRFLDVGKRWAERAEEIRSGVSEKEISQYDKQLKALLDAMNKRQKVTKSEHDFELDLLKTRVMAAKSYSEKVRAEVALIAFEEKKALADLVKNQQNTAANRLKIHEITLLRWGKLEEDNAARIRKVLKKLNDDIIEMQQEETKATEEAVRKKWEAFAAEKKQEKELRKEELKQQKEVANAALGLVTDVFGQSKETAIAGAIINTYEGATKALAQGGIYGAALAAIVIAAGMAQVAKIASTEPGSSSSGDSTRGSGFDDPRNDRQAYMGGQRWAADMVGEWTRGASQGWAVGMRGVGGGSVSSSVSNDNRKSITNHFHGVGLLDTGSVQGLIKLKRALDTVTVQYDDQRTLARR